MRWLGDRGFILKSFGVAFFIFLMMLGSVAYSSECYVKSGVVIKPDKKKVSAGKVLKPCEGSTLSAVLCYENKLEQQICKKKSGEFSLAALVNDRSSKSLLQVIYEIYSPEQNEHYGGKRLKKSETLPGFPVGELLMPASALKFSTKSTVQNFKLYKKDNNKSVFSSVQANATISIPVAKLHFGSRFRWTAQSGGKRFSGFFTITSREDHEEFKTELKDMRSKSDSSESTRHLLRAVLAKEYGYTFDKRQSLNAARLALNNGG
jgi:hypothetical protein